MPGAVFHLTARTQGREPYLRGLESAIQSIICAAPARSDARLIAYAVMPNHIHIVAQQGNRRLADFMQPLLRRIVLLVQRRYQLTGHVFERRFGDAMCADAEYMRNAIIYVHLNPVRAGLAATADDYKWTSHKSFCGGECTNDHLSTLLARESALGLFRSHDRDVPNVDARAYRAFMHWRTETDKWASDDTNRFDFYRPVRPCTAAGDDHWQRWFARYVALEIDRVRIPPRVDMRDIALASIAALAPGMELDDLRSGRVGVHIVRVRRHFILRALAAGYSGRKIAGFLCVSPSTVSSTRAAAPVKVRKG
jgi:REP element-mobilizing transposase RayT